MRDTSSRWGSCSATGTLSFSWRLILAPPFVLDYVAAHEVAHLEEMNHGRRFWSLVHMLCPETDMARSWLRRMATALHLYGPERRGRPWQAQFNSSSISRRCRSRSRRCASVSG